MSGVCVDVSLKKIEAERLTVRGNHWSLLSFSMEDEEFIWSRYFIVSRGEKGNYNYHFGKAFYSSIKNIVKNMKKEHKKGNKL